MEDFTNIMDQSEQFPLNIDLPFSAKGEAIQTLVNPDVGKDRLHDRQTSGIDLPARGRVDLVFHGIDQVRVVT